VDGKVAGSKESPNILFDKDFDGLQTAGEKFGQLIEDAQKEGFKPISIWDELDFQSRQAQSK
jgi:hypothetical protein